MNESILSKVFPKPDKLLKCMETGVVLHESQWVSGGVDLNKLIEV